MDVSLSELRELVMNNEAWRAAIHGVTKSQTRLNDWTELNTLHTSYLFCPKLSILKNIYLLVWLYQVLVSADKLLAAACGI